jgi:hypothetical protein
VAARELAARDIDEVSARAADRALHRVQDSHLALRAQYAPVPLNTANPVKPMITKSSMIDWCSM